MSNTDYKLSQLTIKMLQIKKINKQYFISCSYNKPSINRPKRKERSGGLSEFLLNMNIAIFLKLNSLVEREGL